MNTCSSCKYFNTLTLCCEKFETEDVSGFDEACESFEKDGEQE